MVTYFRMFVISQVVFVVLHSRVSLHGLFGLLERSIGSGVNGYKLNCGNHFVIMCAMSLCANFGGFVDPTVLRCISVK